MVQLILSNKEIARRIWKNHPDFSSDMERHFHSSGGIKTSLNSLVEETYSYGLDLSTDELEECGLGEIIYKWHSIMNSTELLVELCKLAFINKKHLDMFDFEEPDDWNNSVSEALEMM